MDNDSKLTLIETYKSELVGKFALGGYIDGILSLWYTKFPYSEISLTQVFANNPHPVAYYHSVLFNLPCSNIPIIGPTNELVLSDSVEELKHKYDLIKGIILSAQSDLNFCKALQSRIGEFVPVKFVSFSGW